MTKTQNKLFYKIIFFTGLVAMIWEIHIYRQTIIDLRILLEIVLLVGFLTMFFSLNDFQKLFKYSRKSSLYFWTFFQSTVSWGFLTCSVFMFTNYYMASKESNKQMFDIVERSSMSGRKYHREERKPTFSIMYNGKLKKLVFDHKFYEKINTYQSIELEIRKGYFGFDVLKNKILN